MITITKKYKHIDYTKLHQQVLPRDIAGRMEWAKITDLYSYEVSKKDGLQYAGKQYWIVELFKGKEMPYCVSHWLRKIGTEEYQCNVAVDYLTRKEANNYIKRSF